MATLSLVYIHAELNMTQVKTKPTQSETFYKNMALILLLESLLFLTGIHQW